MAEDLCAPRVEGLGRSSLASRRGSLNSSDAIEEQQILGPSAEQLAAIRNRIRDCITSGPDAQRKALLQDMVAKIRVHSRKAIVPVFRLSSWAKSPRRRGVRHLF
jgi:hypothetical protein